MHMESIVITLCSIHDYLHITGILKRLNLYKKKYIYIHVFVWEFSFDRYQQTKP